MRWGIFVLEKGLWNCHLESLIWRGRSFLTRVFRFGVDECVVSGWVTTDLTSSVAVFETSTEILTTWLVSTIFDFSGSTWSDVLDSSIFVDASAIGVVSTIERFHFVFWFISLYNLKTIASLSMSSNHIRCKMNPVYSGNRSWVFSNF